MVDRRRVIDLSADLVAHDVEEQRMVRREDHLDRGGLAVGVFPCGRPAEELGQVAGDGYRVVVVQR